MIRQLLYVSSVRRDCRLIDIPALLSEARARNLRDAITGVLFFDGERFMQVIEGDGAAIDRLFARLHADRRHYAIVKLYDRPIDAREFAGWDMAYRRTGDVDDALHRRLMRMIGHASPSVKATFEGFSAIRNAA